MSAVRRASITQLCAADHGDDPAAIAGWVENQSPASFQALLQREGVGLMVAELDGAVVGVGGLYGDTVTLNYVDPAFRFRGISKALMAALESRMRAAGVVRGVLKSTATARDFYRAIGWSDAGEGTPGAGYPMSKVLG